MCACSCPPARGAGNKFSFKMAALNLVVLYFCVNVIIAVAGEERPGRGSGVLSDDYYMVDSAASCSASSADDPINLFSTHSGFIGGASYTYTGKTTSCYMYLKASLSSYNIRLTVDTTDFCSGLDEVHIYDSSYVDYSESLGYVDKYTSIGKTFTSTGQSVTLKFVRSGCFFPSVPYHGFTLSYEVGDFPLISGGAIAGILLSVFIVVVIAAVVGGFFRRHRILQRTTVIARPAVTAYPGVQVSTSHTTSSAYPHQPPPPPPPQLPSTGYYPPNAYPQPHAPPPAGFLPQAPHTAPVHHSQIQQSAAYQQQPQTTAAAGMYPQQPPTYDAFKQQPLSAAPYADQPPDYNALAAEANTSATELGFANPGYEGTTK